MWDFRIGVALGLLARTAPFLVLRALVYVGIALVCVALTAVGAALGFGVGSLGGVEGRAGGAVLGALVGFGLTFGILLFFRDYLLYVVKAGHIAVLVELLHGGTVPGGRSQLGHASAMVKERFVQTSVLFAVDKIVKAVVRLLVGLIQGVTSMLPIPGAGTIMGLVRAVLRVSVGLVDEVILAYAFRTRATNPWASARTALILYAQNSSVVLKNAVWLAVFGWGLWMVVFLLALAPAAALAYLMPGGLTFLGVLFAIVFAWAAHAALIEPFVLTCLMDVYFRTIEGQTPDATWEARLESASGKFQSLGRQAKTWVPGTPDTPAAPAAPA